MKNGWIDVQIMRRLPKGGYVGVRVEEGGRASYPSTPPLPQRGDWVYVLYGEGALLVEELIYQYSEDWVEIHIMCDDPYGVFAKESK